MLARPSCSGADGCGNQPPITGWLSQPAGGNAGMGVRFAVELHRHRRPDLGNLV